MFWFRDFNELYRKEFLSGIIRNSYRHSRRFKPFNELSEISKRPEESPRGLTKISVKHQVFQETSRTLKVIQKLS